MMETQTPFQFHWNSTLGYSVMLFLLINFCYLVLGILTPLIYGHFSYRFTEMFGLVFSPRSDKEAFGRTAMEIVNDTPSIMVTKVTFYKMYFGMYTSVAILHFCITWFGLRAGHSWALWALTFSNLAIIFFFLMAVRHFSTHLTPLYFSDMPPYAIIPAFILPFAVILGWLGLH